MSAPPHSQCQAVTCHDFHYVRGTGKNGNAGEHKGPVGLPSLVPVLLHVCATSRRLGGQGSRTEATPEDRAQPLLILVVPGYTPERSQAPLRVQRTRRPGPLVAAGLKDVLERSDRVAADSLSAVLGTIRKGLALDARQCRARITGTLVKPGRAARRRRTPRLARRAPGARTAIHAVNALRLGRGQASGDSGERERERDS